MLSNWQNSFELVLDSEGGFSTDPDDRGNQMPDGRPGATNLGVTMMTWEMYVQRQATIDEMKTLTPDDVEPLYKRLYNGSTSSTVSDLISSIVAGRSTYISHVVLVTPKFVAPPRSITKPP